MIGKFAVVLALATAAVLCYNIKGVFDTEPENAKGEQNEQLFDYRVHFGA